MARAEAHSKAGDGGDILGTWVPLGGVGDVPVTWCFSR